MYHIDSYCLDMYVYIYICICICICILIYIYIYICIHVIYHILYIQIIQDTSSGETIGVKNGEYFWVLWKDFSHGERWDLDLTPGFAFSFGPKNEEMPLT